MSGRQVWLINKLEGGGRERERKNNNISCNPFSSFLHVLSRMSESLWDPWEMLWILEVKKNQTQSFTICCRAGLMELMLIKCKGTPLRIGFYAFLKAVMIQGHRSCLSICEVLYIWTLDFYTKHLTLSWIL